jgi:hypothetical protein
MTPFLFRRLVILVSATALACGILTAASAGPAAAQGNETDMYLANASSWGIYGSDGVTSGGYVAVLQGPPWGTWAVHDEGWWCADGICGYGFEFAAVKTSGVISNLCISDTNVPYWPVTLTTCGADGTVWGAVKSGDGYLL